MSITRDDWLAALKEAHNVAPPPTDALSVIEFGKMVGLSRAQAYKHLKLLVDAGAAEVTKKQIRRGGELDGHWMWVPAYRLIKKSSEVAHGDSTRAGNARRLRRGTPRRSR